MNSEQLATALIACWRLMQTKQTSGSRYLFDAVNDAFCTVARR